MKRNYCQKHFYFEIEKYISYFTFSCPPGCKKMVLYIHESVPNIFEPIWLPKSGKVWFLRNSDVKPLQRSGLKNENNSNLSQCLLFVTAVNPSSFADDAKLITLLIISACLLANIKAWKFVFALRFQWKFSFSLRRRSSLLKVG